MLQRPEPDLPGPLELTQTALRAHLLEETPKEPVTDPARVAELLAGGDEAQE